MTLPGALALLCFIGMFALRMFSLVVEGEIMEAVNKRVPPDEQWPRFKNIFAMNSSWWSLFRTYRNLYPSGHLLLRYWLCNAGGLAAFLACIACIFWAVR